MSNNIYGVDLDKAITPLMARDALVECFFQAHCLDAGLDTENPEVNRGYCREIIKKAFIDSGGEFENPTKESITKAVDQLKFFSVKFRDPSIIKKHAEEMMRIIEEIKE